MTEKKILGVCAWLSEILGVNTGHLRIVFIVLFLLFGIGLVAYLILYLFMPPQGESEKLLLGVCIWISNRSGIDVRLIRSIFILVTLFGGVSILAYLILYLVMPKS